MLGAAEVIEDDGNRPWDVCGGGRLEEVYGGGAATAAARYASLSRTFAAAFGTAPELFARCPGRVNLIGDHVDYSGFPVMPMGLEHHDCVVAAARLADGARSAAAAGGFLEVRAVNARGKDFAPGTVRSGDPAALQCAAWTRYVAAALEALVRRAGARAAPSGGEPYFVALAVDGAVPVAAGLSSSSALLCAAALALSRLLGVDMGRYEMAALCADAERLIGMESGGMDQAIGFLSERGFAKRIDFQPLRAAKIRLPASGVWVVADSLVVAKKFEAHGAASMYNLRAVECRLAAAVLATRLAVPGAENVRTLRQLYEANKYVRLVDLEQDVKKLLAPGGYVLSDVCSELGLSEAVVRERYLGTYAAAAELPELQLQRRALHVVGETIRVHHMENLCGREPYEDQLSDMGELLSESHHSSSELFQCSCDEADALVETCLRAGASGARITGAGWGGCVVALVPEEAVASFLAVVTAEYYRGYCPPLVASGRLRPVPDDLSVAALFATHSGMGACVISADFISKL